MERENRRDFTGRKGGFCETKGRVTPHTHARMHACVFLAGTRNVGKHVSFWRRMFWGRNGWEQGILLFFFL